MIIYYAAFAGAIASLAAWFLYRTNDTKSSLFQKSFFATLGLFALSVLFQDAAFSDKLRVMFRDLAVMSGFGLLFQLLSVRKQWFVLGSVIAAIGFGSYQQLVMTHSFDKDTGAGQVTYDASGELLLELAEGQDVDVLSAVVRKYNLELSRAFAPASPEVTELDDYFLIDVPSNYLHILPEVITDLQGIAEVDWVEPNETIKVEPIPGKKVSVQRKYGINDPGLEQLWGFEQMEIDKLYTFLEDRSLEPERKALIAILDTGVDAQHEDIKDNYRSVESKSDDDPRGHGTHCAGIAAAVSNNGVGVASFSRNNEFVQVTSFKVLSASGMGTQKMIINGIIKAADAGADVISLSLGGRSNQSKERAYKKAVDYANGKGAILVVAAGNSNRNAKDYAPAGVPGVITVSALDANLNRAVFSNYITDVEMGIAAPGVNIYSTIPGGKYTNYSGTSMATPYVSGMVGLLKSLDPSLDTQRVYDLLSQTGKDTQNTAKTGYLIQPFQAVQQLVGAHTL